jgi:hypothetical protein
MIRIRCIGRTDPDVMIVWREPRAEATQYGHSRENVGHTTEAERPTAQFPPNRFLRLENCNNIAIANPKTTPGG